MVRLTTKMKALPAKAAKDDEETVFDKVREAQIGLEAVICTHFGERRLLYADFTASGRALSFIEDYVLKEVLPTYANTHTTASATGSRTSALREGARTAVYKAVKADRSKYVALFTGTGVTLALAKLADVLTMQDDDEVVYEDPASDDHLRATKMKQTNMKIGRNNNNNNNMRVVSDDDSSTDEENNNVSKRSFPKKHATKKDVLVLGGPFEHHSNDILWREKKNVDYVAISARKDGLADLDKIKELLSQEQRRKLIVGSFSAGSNVTGIAPSANYKRSLTTLLHDFGALAIWDYAGAGPYVDIDLSGQDAPDAVVVSAHKFIGGPGASGVLVADRRKIFGQCMNDKTYYKKPPTIPGGGTVDRVSRTEIDYSQDLEDRESAGTPGIIQDIRAGLVFQLKSYVTAEAIHNRERAHLERALPRLNQHPKLKLVGSKLRAYWDVESRLGIVSFLVAFDDSTFLHPAFVATILNDLYGIQARPGCMCAGPYGLSLLDIDDKTSAKMMAQSGKYKNLFKPGYTRVNFGAFMTDAEVNFIVDAILQVADRGNDLLTQYKVDAITGEWLPRRKTKLMNHNDPNSKKKNNAFGIDYGCNDVFLSSASLNDSNHDNNNQKKSPLRPTATVKKTITSSVNISNKKDMSHLGRYLSEATVVYAAARADHQCHLDALTPGGDFTDKATELPGTFSELATKNLTGSLKWLYRTFPLPSDAAAAFLGANT